MLTTLCLIDTATQKPAARLATDSLLKFLWDANVASSDLCYSTPQISYQELPKVSPVTCSCTSSRAIGPSQYIVTACKWAAPLLFCFLVLYAHIACPKRMRQNGEPS